jgi:hypothetical protein
MKNGQETSLRREAKDSNCDVRHVDGKQPASTLPWEPIPQVVHDCGMETRLGRAQQKAHDIERCFPLNPRCRHRDDSPGDCDARRDRVY